MARLCFRECFGKAAWPFLIATTSSPKITVVLWLLTTLAPVVILSNMDAKLMVNERHTISEVSFVEMVVWQLPSPVPGSSHSFKYRLALVVNGICVLRYDNEAGKGDHKHKGDEETSYEFITPQLLLKDFWNDVDNWRH